MVMSGTLSKARLFHNRVDRRMNSLSSFGIRNEWIDIRTISYSCVSYSFVYLFSSDEMLLGFNS